MLKMKDTETEDNNVCWLLQICCLGLDLPGIRLIISGKVLIQLLLSKNTSKDGDEGYQRDKRFLSGLC